MDHQAAGEILGSPLVEEAAAAHPVGQGDIDQKAPEHEKPEVTLEVHSIGEGTGDERGSEDGDHLLKVEVCQGRDGGRPWTRSLTDPV